MYLAENYTINTKQTIKSINLFRVTGQEFQNSETSINAQSEWRLNPVYKTHSSEIFTIAKIKHSGEQQVFNKMFVCTTKEEKFCVFFAFFTLMIPLSSCWNSSDAQTIRKNGVLSGNYDRLVRPSQITNVSVAFNLLTINDLVRYRN